MMTKKLKIQIMENGIPISIAKAAARVYRFERSNSLKSHCKYNKREMERTIHERFYHVRNEYSNKIEYINMKAYGFSKNIEGCKYNGLLSCYHLHFDKDLGIGKAAVIRIPCNCESYYEKKCLKWVTNLAPENQPISQRNLECHYSSVFEEYNDWTILDIDRK